MREQALVGPDPEALHHTRAEALDERVGRFDQRQQRLDTVGMLQVDRHVAPPAQQHVEVRSVRQWPAYGPGALDADDFGAHVGEQHRGKRARADAGDFDDAVSGQWSSHVSAP